MLGCLGVDKLRFHVNLSVGKDIEAVGVKRRANNSKLTLIGIDRSPNGNEKVVFSNLDDLLTGPDSP